MTTIEITSFDDLIAAGLKEPDPQLLLLVLLRTTPATVEENPGADGDSAGSGTLTPVMATDLMLTGEVQLETIVEEADSLGEPWDLIMVSSLCSNDGRLPESDDAEPYLKQMAEAVQTGGDLSSYAVFNRAGCPVALKTL